MFSIVIPYYNRARYLPATLASLAAVSYRPLHILLVNNHSTDESEQICRKFHDAHHRDDFRITLLNEPNGFATHARNFGLHHVNTPYVYFFDSDDLLSPHFLDDAYRTIISSKEEPDIVALTTCMTFPNGRRKVRTPRPGLSPIRQILTGMLSTQSMILRTDFVRDIGGWDERLRCWNDWELGLRCLLHHPHMAFLPGQSYHRIVQHPDSITGSNFSNRMADLNLALEVASAEVSALPDCHDAIDARRLILAGHLYHEGNHTAALSLRDAVLGRHSDWRWRVFARYCFNVRRGAWRVYEILSHSKLSRHCHT